MTYAPRKTRRERQWPLPPLDQLERRALMTASSLTHLAFYPVQAHVAYDATSHVARPAQQAATAARAGAHAAAAKHPTPAAPPAKHAATAPAATAAQKAKPAPAAHAKGKPVMMPVQLTNVVKSSLVTKSALATNAPIPGAFGPIQVATAYGVTALGAANQGQGQTIAIIDEYDDPNIIADANKFSSQYGLPQFNVAGGPSMTVYKDNSLATVGSAVGTGVGVETSLDVEWAHAMAPRANILLVEVPAVPIFTRADLNQDFVYLLAGIQYAASHGASVISLSYGFHESSGIAANYPSFGLPDLYLQNQTYLSSAPVANVAVTVSTGDNSYPGFPGTSPNVIGVGGTALRVDSKNNYLSETAWGGLPGDGAGGGGPSAFFATPTYQGGSGINYGRRNVPDVSLLADPATGVSVYDSLDAAGGNPWTAVGGTSLAAPLFAGMLSIVQQQRVAAGKPILTSAQINAADYALYVSPNYLTYFHDITQGINSDLQSGYAGFKTSTGYDQATGLGSPIANKLIPYLAGL